LIYEKEKAFWFKSSLFGDDKDRVLVKDGGRPTYFLSDIAYLRNKFDRKFKKLFFFWGADHFGYINRMKAAAQALGYKKDDLEIIIMQLVRLIEKGKEVRMSKRSGLYVALDELVEEVGLDVARFFFLAKAPGTHLDFNLSLAKERSDQNPVYYVQYAYARISSILRKSKKKKDKAGNSRLLKHPSELALMKQLIRFPEIIEDVTKDYQVQRLPQYSIDLATAFHRFYKDCRVISEDEKLSQARLALTSATEIVLKDSLGLMGISSPKKM
jgi:arginyl-tRNA synthetase